MSRPTDSTLDIVVVYPELLGLYGDRGNALALLHRARARGIAARMLPINASQDVPDSGDIYLLGGGEDAPMLLAGDLLEHQPTLGRVLENGVTALAVCAGFQLLSKQYTGPDGVQRAGLGVLDVTCGRLQGERAVGEVVCEDVGHGLGQLSGFENHQGDARLGPDAKPLGQVVTGVGNGPDGWEGAIGKGVVATYLHGPVLVRNPALADHLLARALGGSPLAPLEEESVDRLRRERLREGRQRGTGRRRAVSLRGR